MRVSTECPDRARRDTHLHAALLLPTHLNLAKLSFTERLTEDVLAKLDLLSSRGARAVVLPRPGAASATILDALVADQAKTGDGREIGTAGRHLRIRPSLQFPIAVEGIGDDDAVDGGAAFPREGRRFGGGGARGGGIGGVEGFRGAVNAGLVRSRRRRVSLSTRAGGGRCGRGWVFPALSAIRAGRGRVTFHPRPLVSLPGRASTGGWRRGQLISARDPRGRVSGGLVGSLSWDGDVMSGLARRGLVGCGIVGGRGRRGSTRRDTRRGWKNPWCGRTGTVGTRDVALLEVGGLGGAGRAGYSVGAGTSRRPLGGRVGDRWIGGGLVVVGVAGRR